MLHYFKKMLKSLSNVFRLPSYNENHILGMNEKSLKKNLHLSLGKPNQVPIPLFFNFRCPVKEHT